jgi:exopolysaccharide biosynthesis protein
MRTPGQMSAGEYLARGATDVLAFGPILFSGRVLDERLQKSFTHLEPRSALGVVSPGHFVGIMVEGRNKRSAGAGLAFVAQRLLEQGCTDAFTLDGGQTAAMVFMGKNVMDPGIYNGFHKTRNQQDVVGIGRSDLVGSAP